MDIILDIETYPIEESEANSNVITLCENVNFSRSNAKEETKFEAYEEIFPKIQNKHSLCPVTSRVIVVGMLEAYSRTLIRYYDKDEHTLLTNVAAYLNMLRTKHDDLKIVTFNGAEFDLPFLSYRMMLYGVNCVLPIDKYPRLDKHIDIFKILEHIGMTDNLHHKLSLISLNKWSKILLGKSKPDIDVLTEYKLGNMNKILEYNKVELNLIADIYTKINNIIMRVDYGTTNIY